MSRALSSGAVLVAIGCVVAACKSNAGSSQDQDLTVTGQPSKGSAGGFSATLGAELAGSGAAPKAGTVSSTSAAPSAGSAATAAGGAGAGSPAPAMGAGAGSSGSAAGAGSASASGSVLGSPASLGIAPAPAPGPAPAPSSGSATGAASGSASTGASAAVTSAGATSAGATSAPVKVSAELAAIKLALLPNWERDVGEGGTISLSVHVQRTGQKERFKFHYGYEDPSAPQDRDAYKKFLADSKVLRVSTDRQRGTAWLLEGRDASGGQAFRIVVMYGGKRLVCYGSLYKGSSLGDFRDEVLIQARKICESISL